MEFDIKKMGHANHEKRKTAKDGRNTTTKSGKNLNARRKGKLQALGNIGVDTIKKVVMKEKLEKCISGKRENYRKPNYIADTLSPSRIFLKWTREELQQMAREQEKS